MRRNCPDLMTPPWKEMKASEFVRILIDWAEAKSTICAMKIGLP